MKKLTLVFSIVMIAGLSGCAHKVMRGTVAMKTSENEAHVCMGKGEVAVGDKVTLFRNECVGKGVGDRPGGGGTCEKKEVGSGMVQEVLNQHYSVVRFAQGVQFEEGSFVEKR